MTPSNFGALTALSPLDGRYAAKVEPLRAHFSDAQISTAAKSLVARLAKLHGGGESVV